MDGIGLKIVKQFSDFHRLIASQDAYFLYLNSLKQSFSPVRSCAFQSAQKMFLHFMSY